MKYLYRIFIIVAILVLCFGLLLCFFLVPRHGEENQHVIHKISKNRQEPTKINVFDEDENPLHILVLGLDKTKTTYEVDDDSMRSDTIMLVTVDPLKDKVQVISIPRDTFYKIPGYDNYKINAAYSRGGLDLAIETIEEFMDTKIDHYVTVDYKAVEELVDAVGGVEVYTPKYHYEDPSTIPKLVIDFEEGLHHLNGEEAVKYLRIRKYYEDQDLGRINAQQKFLMKVFDKLKAPRMFFQLPRLINIANRYLESDLNYGQLSFLAYYGLTLEKDDIQMITLPGEEMRKNKIDYFNVNQKEAQDLLRDFEKWEPDESHLSEEERQKREELRQKRRDLINEALPSQNNK